MSKKALLAGWGNLPLLWAEKAKMAQEDFIIISIAEEITANFSEFACQEYTINLSEFNKLIELLKAEQVSDLIMLGKIQKAHLFAGFEPDIRLKKLLAGLPNFNDDTIMLALVKEFTRSGINVLPQDYLLQDQLAKTGVLAGKLTEQLKTELSFAFTTAYNLGQLDIGQTALTKNGAVLALEAIEGTDQAIKRAAEFGGPGIVMAKCSKKEQDLRFDLPTVGLQTLDNLISSQAAALIIESGKTFILNQAEFLQRAAANNLVVVAAGHNKGELIFPWQK
ncbi:LpxI family protein [Halanaerobium salsuginis]|uniref:DUF1009 domain-containing protein n=1 Tax=Halanaerobium salsuginis TaxID=29563 RepID=A0A1I4FLZ5_9FIRM|nr:UDP-2,3-diacylglucosamine diphosphatase LpxI [Halanaerobium salsuginis]SFL18493.1 hypothetical protein SAMN02983006_00411 [Halanaerobium salsuginis]